MTSELVLYGLGTAVLMAVVFLGSWCVLDWRRSKGRREGSRVVADRIIAALPQAELRWNVNDGGTWYFPIQVCGVDERIPIRTAVISPSLVRLGVLRADSVRVLEAARLELMQRIAKP